MSGQERATAQVQAIREAPAEIRGEGAANRWRKGGSRHSDPRLVCVSEFATWARRSGGAAVLVMKTSQMGESNDASPAGLFDGPSLWALLFH